MFQRLLICMGLLIILSSSATACSWKVGEAEGVTLECATESGNVVTVACYESNGVKSAFYGDAGATIKWSGDGGSRTVVLNDEGGKTEQPKALAISFSKADTVSITHNKNTQTIETDIESFKAFNTLCNGVK